MLATIVMTPTPHSAASSSAEATIPQQTPIATRMPVKISRNVLGRMTWRNLLKANDAQIVGFLDMVRLGCHDEQLLPEEDGFLDPAGDEDDGLPSLVSELKDQALHLLTGQRVESAERFVRKDEFRIVGEAADKGAAAA